MNGLRQESQVSWTHLDLDATAIDRGSVKKLGQGTFGVAHMMPGGQVLKLTSDKSEVALMTLGQSLSLMGFPAIFSGPARVQLPDGISGTIWAYEREDLKSLPPFARDLGSLNSCVHWVRMGLPEGLQSYEQAIYSETLAKSFPMVMHALQVLYRHGLLVWDLSRRNLGFRQGTRDVVVRDARMMKIPSGKEQGL